MKHLICGLTDQYLSRQFIATAIMLTAVLTIFQASAVDTRANDALLFGKVEDFENTRSVLFNSQIVNNLGFSSMTVGQVKPITFTINGGIYNEYYQIYFQSYQNPHTLPNPIGFSTSPNGPFTTDYTEVYRITTFNSWTSPTIYIKALVQTTQAFISITGDGLAGIYGDADAIGITAAPPTTASLTMESSTSEISVGWKQNMRIKVKNAPNVNDTFRVAADTASVMLFSLSPNGTYSTYIDVPVTTNSTGDGYTPYFYLKGQGKTAGMATLPKITACGNSLPCISPYPIKILNVYSINLSNYYHAGNMTSPNPNLDNNPNAGGGMRIFPEKKTPGDNADAPKRRYVRVIALLSEQLANREIEFQVYDVDDPSTNDPVLDPNGNSGNDNRSVDRYFVESGDVSATAVTDVNGNAEVTLAVSQQPGDNYRIAAVPKVTSANNAAQNNILDNVEINGQYLAYEAAQVSELFTQPSDAVASTKMLTVWRRLHVERDSMGTISGNLASGSVSAVMVESDSRTAGYTRLALSTSPANAAAIASGRFKNGRIYLYSELPNSPAASFFVYQTSSTSVWVAGVVPQIFIGSQFSLFDDDDFNGNDTADTWHGDNGDDIPQPNTGWMQDSDDPALNKFAAAYIRPTYDLTGNDNNLPFVANVPKADLTSQYPTDAEFASLGKFDNIAHRTDSQFWIVYLLEAYQTDAQEDFDPSDDATSHHWTGYLGICVPSYGGFIFPENFSDSYGHHLYTETDSHYVFYDDLRYASPHETSHLLNTENDDGGFMSFTNDVFSNVSLDHMRYTVVPTSGVN